MPANVAAIPRGSGGWCLYSGGRIHETGGRLDEVAGRRADVVVGLPVTAVSSFCVSLPTKDSALFENMAYAQIEKRGLGSGSREATFFDFELLESRETDSVIAVHVLRPEMDQELVLPLAVGYTPASDLYVAPEGGCLLLKEQGRYVLALFHAGKLAHTQILSASGDFGAGIAREVNLTLLSLHAEEILSASDCLVAIEGLNSEERESFSAALKKPVTFVETPQVVSRPKHRERLLLRPVIDYRRRKRSLQRNLIIAAFALVAYLVAGAWVWKSSRATERRISTLEQQVAIIEPDVEEIQMAAQRWQVLEPAFDLSYFPVVQLSRITAALPGSGVVIREFRTTGRAMRIRGQARDVQLANRLLEDLNAMEEFKGYEFNMPNPRVEGNNTATFEIEGKPANAGAN